MALQGKAILEFAREKKVNNRIRREVVKRVEKKNTITGLLDNVLNDGNFHNMVLASKIYPPSQWFEGCLLTDKVNNANLMMLAHDSEVIAQAGSDAYSGTNLKRGSFNSNESGAITGGLRRVWDWNTSQGNGTIASVCLTRNVMGITEYSPSDDPATFADEWLHGSSVISSEASTLGNCIIIDYANNKGYDVYYSSGVITVDVYRVSTSVLSLTDELYKAELIETHTISQSVDNYSLSTASVSFTGDTIHLLTFQSGTGNLKDYAISLNNWSCTVTSHTYSGVYFRATGNWRTVKLVKDMMPIVNGYLFALSWNSGLKIVKCSLTNDADVTEYNHPWSSVISYSEGEYVGPSMLLPNGDMYMYYKTGSNRGVYYHNGTFNKVKTNIFQSSAAYDAVGANANEHGTALLTDYSGLGNASWIVLATMFPYVSTVANLEDAVTKSADLTMKLTYEITEVAS